MSNKLPSKACDVGTVRALLEGLPDDAKFFPKWHNGPPDDSEPVITVFGFRRMPNFDGVEGVAILVGLVNPEDIRNSQFAGHDAEANEVNA